jgi:hypothetical protein
MPFTSDQPILIDGVRLDTLAWNIAKINRSTAGRRSADVAVPGMDGVVPSLNDDLEPATFGLDMFVRGTDADGAVPTGGSRAAFWANLDELVHLFGKRHGLIEVREQTGPGTPSTNLAVNPGSEVVVQQWVGGGGNGTIVLDTAVKRSGAQSSRVDWVTGTWGQAFGGPPAGGVIPIKPNTTYVVSAWIYWASGARPSFNCVAQGYVRAGTVLGVTALQLGQWGRITCTYKTGPDDTGLIWYGATSVASSWHVDDVLVEEGTSLSDFWDGSTVDTTYDYAWVGTPGNSQSTRTPKSTRRAFAKVTDTLTPDVNAIGTAGTFTVALSVPAGCWEDPTSTDWFSSVLASGTAVEVTSLRGATERNQDGVILVTGPGNNPRVTDPSTGAYVQLNQNLAAGQAWRINLQTWDSRYGAGLTLASADGSGTDGAPSTVWGGASTVAAYTTLQPARTPGDPVRRTWLTLTVTGGLTSSTRLSVRARRKYAL